MSDLLKFETADGVATLTLNRPDKMNALNSELRRALKDGLARAEADEEVGVIILTGAGRAFCAGLDLKELGGESQSDSTLQSTVTGGPIVQQFAATTKPIIGAINGVAITGGFEIALCCDVLIASTHARFADTHARVGILPGWGLSQRLSRLIGIYRAKELSLTGNFLDAGQAERWGLVNRVVEPDKLLSVARELAQDMRSCDPVTLTKYKRLIDDGYAMDFGRGRGLELQRSKAHAQHTRPEDVAKRREAIQARGRTQG